ncbi:MAG TPA: QueG-associated DUF1730 domain-containing protein, partial [Kofleriaceae bacterium]|nr:QueG-associated DUF1730 domain-containing protein [Kofleriaceae bacterium]
MTAAELTRAVLEAARELGFHRAGVAAVEPARRHGAYEAWIAGGMHGDMAYLATPAHRAGRADVRALLPEARSVVSVALAYDAGVVPVEQLRDRSNMGGTGGAVRGEAAGEALPPTEDRTCGPEGSAVPRGTVARYARGRDYHALMKARLRELAARVAALVGREVAARPCVDTAPVLERDVAERAGVGFVGKNTLLI